MLKLADVVCLKSGGFKRLYLTPLRLMLNVFDMTKKECCMRSHSPLTYCKWQRAKVECFVVHVSESQ